MNEGRVIAGWGYCKCSQHSCIKKDPLVAPYIAAKVALVSLSRSEALEGKLKGIRTNAGSPGAVDTPVLWNNPNVKAGVEKINPARVEKPENIAAAVAYLASSEAFTGCSLFVQRNKQSAYRVDKVFCQP